MPCLYPVDGTFCQALSEIPMSGQTGVSVYDNTREDFAVPSVFAPIPDHMRKTHNLLNIG